MIDTSQFTVVRGDALLKSKGKEPRAIMNDGRPIGTHPHGPSMPRPHAAHKTLDAAKWVALAQASGDNAEKRPLLAETWYHGTSNLCVDGHRMHSVEGERMSNARTEAPGTLIGKDIVSDFLCLFPRETPYRFTVRVQALVSALYAVRPFARDSSDIVRFEASAIALVVRATSWESGDAQVTIEGADYAPGSDLPSEFALNSKYALEACSGMGERVEVATHSQRGEQAFTFTSEVKGVVRRALVMPMQLGRD